MGTRSSFQFQLQNKSDPSSSDDGVPQMTHHRIAAGIRLAHSSTFAHAGILSKPVEMKTFRQNYSEDDHRAVDREHSFMARNPLCSEREKAETLSLDTTNENFANCKRSQSYHGTKGSLARNICRSLL
jgi:hypothetical protein